MAIYAISDLHLSFDVNKPMNVFGKLWDNYEEKIKEDWISKVKENDTVIIPGDISWGMTLKEIKKDFKYIDDMPGKKIILKGNHDYYFTTKTKLENFFKECNFNSINILYNNEIELEEYVLCGTRGWGSNESKDLDLDKKLIRREEIRLENSLMQGKKISNGKKDILVAMHFPPFTGKFCDIMKNYNVKKCIYGHLHGFGHTMVKEGIIDGIEYVMVSCDFTKFKLVRL